MINVIIATHGPLARAFLESARMVYGELPQVFSVMLNEQAGIDGFKRDFVHVLARASENADGVLVLCDLQSGTPWNVACQYAFSPHTTPPVAVLAGVNFPMLLQSEEIGEFTDVHRAADRLLALTLPTLVKAVPVISDPSDDF